MRGRGTGSRCAALSLGLLGGLRACSSSAALDGYDLLSCEWDASWASFRRQLEQNAGLGFPVDEGLVLEAQRLLQTHQDDLVVDSEAAYGASAGMQSFFRSCNAPPAAWESLPPPFCLYGAVAALWVVARSGHPDRQHLLGIAEFLLGSTMRGALDFMESAGWPLTSVDVLANLQHPEESFRLPSELHELRPPHPGPSLNQHPGRSDPQSLLDVPVRVVVWEIGVHASLSAEPLQMLARFLPRVQISHRNLIQDQYPKWLPDKCDTLYRYERLTCDTIQDDITELFRRRIPHSAVSKDPVESIEALAEEFSAVAGRRLTSVDVFLCTVPYLCLLVVDLNLPVLGYFGHPLLFLVPRTDAAKESFWSRFAAMAHGESFGLAVSDPFLQMQYEYQVGAPRLPAIRTHALYTESVHFPSREREVLVMDRPHESVLMCMIQHLLPTGGADAAVEDLEWPLGDGRLRSAGRASYPLRFITRSLTDRRFTTFASFRAVVLWAYDMDLITFYEFYSMNMPLFMPSHLPKYVFQQDHMLYDGRWEGRRADDGLPPMWPAEAKSSPFNETSIDAVRLIVGFSDYFRFPEVQYFESIPDLLYRLPNTDFFHVVQVMARFNRDSLVESAGAWRGLLRRAAGWDAEMLPS